MIGKKVSEGIIIHHAHSEAMKTLNNLSMYDVLQNFFTLKN